MSDYIVFISLAIRLIDAASDGELTREEIYTCIGDSLPGTKDIISAIDDTLEDGKISCMEALNVVSTIICK